MNFYIREHPDGTASLITDNGSVIWTFPGLDGARKACSSTHRVHVEFYPVDDGLVQDPCCSSCAIA